MIVTRSRAISLLTSASEGSNHNFETHALAFIGLDKH